jgi:hypothetical protein
MAGRLQPPKDQSVDNFWVNQWLVDFNPEKTKALIISNTANIDPVIKFNDEQVEIVLKSTSH